MAVVDRLQGFNIGAAMKPACVVATTGAITLQGVQTIDGISVGSCERVLVKDQTDPVDNGIYIADSSTWLRARDFDGARDAIPGTLVYVDRGTFYGTSFWVLNSSSTATKVAIGTDSITLSQVTQSLSGVTAFSSSALTLASAASWRTQLELGAGSTLSSTAFAMLDSTGQAFTGVQSWMKGDDLVSANSLTLGSTGNYFDVTGGTTINTIAAVRIGTVIGLHFDSTLVLTNSTALVLAGSADIVTIAGDEAQFTQYTTSADWRLTKYLRASGLPLAVVDEDDMASDSSSKVPTQQSVKAYVDTAGWKHATSAGSTTGASVSFGSISSGVTFIALTFAGVTQNTANNTMTVQIGGSTGLSSTGYGGVLTAIKGGSAAFTRSPNGASFQLTDNEGYDASEPADGRIVLENLGSNVWSISGNLTVDTSVYAFIPSGTKTLASPLTQLQIAIPAGAFTAGMIYLNAR